MRPEAKSLLQNEGKKALRISQNIINFFYGNEKEKCVVVH